MRPSGWFLIAGSQLSSIGQLQFGPRLGAAVIGVVVALMAIVFAVWSAVQILIPVGVMLTDLERGWSEAAQWSQ